jgi:single-strand DNA-binding protein
VWNSKGTGLADVVEKYCKKGDRIYVEGRIEYRQWQDKENQTRYSTEINVRELMMLGGARGGTGADFGAEGSGRSRAPATAGAKAGAASAGGADFEDFPGALEDGDDDLPF